MLEFLVVLFILSLVFGSLFKTSVGLMKLVLSILGTVIVIILIPVALVLIVPLLIIGFGIGLLKLIF